MTEVAKAPPLHWLLGNVEQRRIARRYWLRDPVVGTAELALHILMRFLPIDARPPEPH